jgi:hypothetical protein
MGSLSFNSITERMTEGQTGDVIRPVVTYLGPAGTYSHQVGHSSLLNLLSTSTGPEPFPTGRV